MAELDKIDRKILTALEIDARIPLSRLAKKARVSRSVAEYRLKQFREKDIVRGYYCLLDPSQFGLTVWKLWVGLQRPDSAFFSFIEKHPRVWWYGECAGVYNAVICVLCRSPHDFNHFFIELQKGFGRIITDSSILINVSFEYHTRGYLLDEESKLIESSFQEKPMANKSSGKSFDLLKLLSKNSRASYASLSQETGLHVKTIKSRIKELKEHGVIVYFRPSIDASKFGYDFYKVLLYLHNPKGGVVPNVVHWCRQNKHITAVISCVGPWQLELELEINSYRSLCSLLDALKEKFPDVVKRYEILLLTKEGNYELDLVDKMKDMMG